jgi:RNA polymerase sigma factor (sigma-70 family)
LPFRALPETQLDALSDDALIAYVLAARDAGDAATARTALRVLVWGHYRSVEYKVALRVPREDVDDVACDAIASALTAAFDGTSAGEFRSWLATIVKRRIADYHRKVQRTLDQVVLDPTGGEAGEGAVPWEADESGYVEVQVILQDLLDALDPAHREAIRLYVFEDRPAGEVAARMDGMTEANVHQIASRFRRDLLRRLEAGDG